MQAKLLGLLAAGLLAGPMPASAVMIDFNSAALGTFNSLTVGDYLFLWVGSGDQMEVLDIGEGNYALADSNPFNDLSAAVTMSRVDGLPFTVMQFEVLDALGAPAPRPLAGGALLSLVAVGAQNLYIAGTFGAVNLVNVAAAPIAITSVVDEGGAGALFLDNIHATGSLVPEPGSLALLGLGLVGLGLGRRRRAA